MRGSKGMAEVISGDHQAKKKGGITGVPYFVIRSQGGGKSFVLNGAESVANFEHAFKLALSQGEASPEQAIGPSCKEGTCRA